MRHKSQGGLNSCVSGLQSGSQSRLVGWCLTGLLWLAATRPAQGFGHHIKLAGKACPLRNWCAAVVLHVSATYLTLCPTPGHKNLLIGLCRPAH